VGTTLDNASIPDAPLIWADMIRRAQREIVFAEFYGISRPGGRLEPILEAINEAASRGVKIRFLFDAKFYARDENKRVPDALKTHANIDVRIYDMGPVSDGVLHAKFFVIDGEEAYLGSQNFDWRSLEHIQELGVQIAEPQLARALHQLFELDWAIAGGQSFAEAQGALRQAAAARIGEVALSYGGGRHLVWPAFSPQALLVDDTHWDLPRLESMIDGAQRRIRLQLMTYSVVNYDKSRFDTLDQALRKAAARGVQVELLFADWMKRAKTIGHIQALQKVPNITIKLVSIPPWSGGHIPFARVVHCKYMIVDDASSWLGTSNWSGDYFFKSRNVGLWIQGERFNHDLNAFFTNLWESAYAEEVDPDATYEPPQIK